MDEWWTIALNVFLVSLWVGIGFRVGWCFVDSLVAVLDAFGGGFARGYRRARNGEGE